MMNKLRILLGTILVMAGLLFIAYPIDTLPHPVCVANLKAPLQAVVGQSVAFDASSSFCYMSDTGLRLPISNYVFKFGDGAALSGTAPTAAHAFSAIGTYSPSVTVTVQGWQATAITRISVVSTVQEPLDPYPYMPQLPVPKTILPNILINLTNFPPHILSFVADTRTGVEPLTVSFSGAAADPNNDPLTYTLFYDVHYFSINKTGTIGRTLAALGNHTYAAGNYTARLDVSDGRSTARYAIRVMVSSREHSNQLPIACMTASDRSGYLPFTITFNGSCSYDPDSSIVYHAWRIEKDGAVITEVPGNSSPGTWQYTFTEQGKHFVYLKVMDEQNGTSETNVTIVAEQYPLGPIIGWFRGEPSSGYAPLTVSFKSSAVGIYPLTYTLFFSTSDRSKNVTGIINSTDSVLGTFLYISGGTFGKTYTSELVVTDQTGASISKSTSTHVSPSWTNPDDYGNKYPIAQFGYEPQEVFVNQEVRFTDTSYDTDGHMIYWIWTFGDGAASGDQLVSGEQNPKHVYTAPGTYDVTLKVYDDDGYMNTTKTVPIEVKSVEEQPAPAIPAGGGGGGGGGGPSVYGPQPASPIKTSGITYLGFHPSFALNGTRTYSYDPSTNTTTIVFKLTNLARLARLLSIRDIITKDMATSMMDVQIIPVPTSIYNMDPDIGWNVTLGSQETFTAKYIFSKYIPFASFDAMPLPKVTELKNVSGVPTEAPVSPTTKVTVPGGITGFVITTFSNPWAGVVTVIAILVLFFVSTNTGRETWDKISTKTGSFVSSIAEELEEPKEHKEKSERVKRLKKLMKKKRK